jgi:hypothetical protein
MSEPNSFPVRILKYLAESFIAAFGITRPSRRQEQKVLLPLGAFLLLAGVAALGLLGFLLWEIHLGRR